jgi:hypothetical protein
MKQVPFGTNIEKSEFVYSIGFMCMEHNYLCAICKENSAVQDTHLGILQPCWICQKYFTKLRKKNWFDKILERLK